ncbi:MAG TPA: iron-containing alcohol dehydrogenase [Magnetospirillum sp.]|jgi:NADP-dependent alcohol dehydrogenase|nr:iron-containing alcohol dehydrogenase [Magnetospirillum sp.]
MENFVFHNPVKLIFGKGQIKALGSEIPKGSRVLFAYGGGSIKANGVHAQVVEALTGAGLYFKEFAGIEPNPRFETLMKAVELARAERLDFVLAVGGGSVVDGCKLVAAAIDFAGDPWTIVQRKAQPTNSMPLGVVLTLPATGSEMNLFSVVSREATGEKLGWGHPSVMPRFSVLDPETTYSLPDRQVGNGIVDAYVHVLEQYLTYPANAPLQDRLAEAVLSTLIEIGAKAMETPPDYQARANLMWCATMALNGLIGQGVPQDWATHMIGHELTAITGIDHARTLAAVWPGVVAVRREAKRDKLLQYAERVWGLTEGPEEERISQAVTMTCRFFESVGVPTGLKGYGLPGDIPGTIAKRLKDRGGLPLGERGDINAELVRAILEAA